MSRLLRMPSCSNTRIQHHSAATALDSGTAFADNYSYNSLSYFGGALTNCRNKVPLLSSLRQYHQHRLCASKLDEIFSLDTSSAGSGVSYELLKERLEAGDWEAADEETRRLLCVLAGEAAAKRKWIYFSEVKFIPINDLQTLDMLWRSASSGKFGYSVQRRIWKSVNGDYTAFFKKVDWTRPLDERSDTYRKFPVEFLWDDAAAPDGHLPLTNCLRGTQLLREILLHPAFDELEQQEGLSMPSMTSPSVL